MSDLDDFTSYLADKVWPFLPTVLHKASYDDTRNRLPEINLITYTRIFCGSYGLSLDDDAALVYVIEDYIVKMSMPLLTICTHRDVRVVRKSGAPSRALRIKWGPGRTLNSSRLVVYCRQNALVTSIVRYHTD